MRVRRKMFWAILVPAVSTVLHHESSDTYRRSVCFIELSSASRVRPVPLLNSDRLSTLPGSVEIRSAMSTSLVHNDVTENSLTFADAIEQRLKRIEEKHEEKYKQLEEENRQLKQRLATVEKLQQDPKDSSPVEGKELSTGNVKVNGVRHGATVLILYLMARECAGVNSTCSVVDRSATRRHREQHSVNFRWEWWAQIAFFSFFLQMAMIVIFHYGMTLVARESAETQPLPAWQISIAGVVFAYDAFRAGVFPWFSGIYCFWRMESLQLFRKHTYPKRTRVCALLFVGLEILVFITIMLYGINLLQLSQSPLDLILNSLALHFLYEIDDIVVHIGPGLGLLGDIDVPRSVVLPTYVSEPQWRGSFFFYWFAKFLQNVTLSPLFPIVIASVAAFTGDWGKGFYQQDPRQLENVYTARWVYCYVEGFTITWMAIPSVMSIWDYCKKSTDSSSLGSFVMYTKIGCFLLVYFAIILPASISFNVFLTVYFEFSLFTPPFIGAGICWSSFMAFVILLIH